jgi:superfamily II DNA or RNA helicase
MKILDTFSDSKLLGVTATPHRLDYWGFAHIFDKLIVSPDPMEFIKSGFLSNYDYYSVPPECPIVDEINAIPIEKGDFAEDYLLGLLDCGSIRAQVVDSYMKYGCGKKAIVYTINKAHNKHLCEEYKKRGINAVTIDCDTTSVERKQLLDAFKKGNIQIICNVNILSEGFDCPDVEVIQITRPTYSLSMYLQQVGRGLRVSPGKDKTMFIDNVGSYLRFGLPSEHRSWEKYFNRKPTSVRQQFQGSPDTKSQQDGKIEEGNEEVRLIYSTAPEKTIEKPIATSTPTQKDNEKLAPILLLYTYLQHWN